VGAPLIAGLLIPSLAAADSMRCGSRIVKDEDSIDKVLASAASPSRRNGRGSSGRRSSSGAHRLFISRARGRAGRPVDLRLRPEQAEMRVRFVAGQVQSITPRIK